LLALYRDIASDSAIDSFLKASRFYSVPERRWKLPQNYTKLLDAKFYTPFRNIISSVVRRFWGDASRQRSRLFDAFGGMRHGGVLGKS
jgi:hypothetical protein